MPCENMVTGIFILCLIQGEKTAKRTTELLKINSLLLTGQ